jgi:hypothetical protein
MHIPSSGRVQALSFDFDLGFRGEEERLTGEVVLQWIEERVFSPRTTTQRYRRPTTQAASRRPLAAAAPATHGGLRLHSLPETGTSRMPSPLGHRYSLVAWPQARQSAE